MTYDRVAPTRAHVGVTGSYVTATRDAHGLIHVGHLVTDHDDVFGRII